MNTENENILLIIGAGGSAPYGFPTASTLRENIIEEFPSKYLSLSKGTSILNTKATQYQFQQAQRKEYVKQFCQKFELSSIQSIDYFISRNPKYSDFGKDAIILHILESERNSKRRGNDGDWYTYLFNKMISELKSPNSFDEISNNSYSFLTFNYDRSLENFLCESLFNSFEDLKTTEQLKQTMSSIPITHVYGKIAALPFGDEDGLTYGQKITLDDLPKLRENIKTVSEINNTDTEITDNVAKANMIFFLGFGYDKINLKNIGIPFSLRPEQKIYGTSIGYNYRFTNDLKEYLVNYNYFEQRNKGEEEPTLIRKEDIIFEDLDSLALLQNYL